MQVCDPVGSEHIDILPVVGLHPQLWKCLHHPIQVLRRTGRQIGLHQKFVFLEVIDGRPVGEDHRGIDGGQMEAGRSLGFNYAQTMWYIIMPQAFKTVLPTLCNEFISLLKETSVAGYIAIQDLTKGGDIIRSRTYSAFMPLIAVALIYLIIVMIFTKLIQILERRLRQNER